MSVRKKSLSFIFLVVPSFSAMGATIDVDGTSGVVAVDGKCSIVEAIENANGLGSNHDLYPGDCSSGSGGTDTLVLKNDVTLASKYAPQAAAVMLMVLMARPVFSAK
jgi:hypothetical protein